MSEGRPEGRRFSELYLPPGEVTKHSDRLQRRISAFVYAELDDEASRICARLRVELGAELPARAYPVVQLRDYIQSASTEDFLEAITVISWELRDIRRVNARFPGTELVRWIAFAQRAFAEEAFAYEVDDNGGIHPRVDPIFARSTTDLLRGLSQPRYAVAAEHFDQAMAALDGRPPATNRAIRETFLCVEEIFRLVCPTAKRLETTEINNKLKGRVSEILNGPELDSTKLMLTAFGSYISASHNYRHAQGQPEPKQAAMSMAVWMVQSGSAYARWLMDLEENLHPKTPD